MENHGPASKMEPENVRIGDNRICLEGNEHNKNRNIEFVDCTRSSKQKEKRNTTLEPNETLYNKRKKIGQGDQERKNHSLQTIAVKISSGHDVTNNRIVNNEILSRRSEWNLKLIEDDENGEVQDKGREICMQDNLREMNQDEIIRIKQEKYNEGEKSNLIDETDRTIQYDGMCVIEKPITEGENVVRFTTVNIKEEPAFETPERNEVEFENRNEIITQNNHESNFFEPGRMEKELSTGEEEVVQKTSHRYESTISAVISMCSLCEVSVPESLNVHAANVHKNGIFLACPYCDYGIRGFYHKLGVHMSDVHKNYPPMKCSYCGLKFMRWNFLIDHLNADHSEQVDKVCIYCGYQGQSYIFLVHHILSSHSDNYFINKCKDCNFTTLNPSLLEKHIIAKHTLYYCLKCEFTTSKNSDLDGHNKSAHAPPPKKKKPKRERPLRECLHCNFRVKHQSSLKSHIISKHNGEFTVKCDFCEFECFSFSKMQEHVLKEHESTLSSIPFSVHRVESKNDTSHSSDVTYSGDASDMNIHN